MSGQSRIIGYDIMRIVAATMVVCIHSNVYFLNNADSEMQWLIIMLMTAMCVVSVPLFFMVSGAGNLVKNDITSFQVLFKRKIPKVFIPFIIWSLIYVGLRIYAGKIDFDTRAFLSLLWEPAYYQFWFMYSLLGMYLCIPVFQNLIIRSSKKLLQYILVFWIISSLIFPLLERYIPGFKLSGHFNLIFLEGYWGYFFLGGYLRKYPLARPMKAGCIVFIAGTIITIISAIMEWKLTPADKYYGYVYCAYLLPGAALMSVGVFLIFQHINISHKWNKIITYLSGLTMGIFYIHLLFITVYENLSLGEQPTVLNALVKFVAVVIVSFLVCAALKQINPIQKYLL